MIQNQGKPTTFRVNDGGEYLFACDCQMAGKVMNSYQNNTFYVGNNKEFREALKACVEETVFDQASSEYGGTNLGKPTSGTSI